MGIGHWHYIYCIEKPPISCTCHFSTVWCHVFQHKKVRNNWTIFPRACANNFLSGPFVQRPQKGKFPNFHFSAKRSTFLDSRHKNLSSQKLVYIKLRNRNRVTQTCPSCLCSEKEICGTRRRRMEKRRQLFPHRVRTPKENWHVCSVFCICAAVEGMFKNMIPHPQHYINMP